MAFDGDREVVAAGEPAASVETQGLTRQQTDSRPYNDRFVMLPRTTFKSPPRGLRARHLYLLISLYRLAFEGRFARVTPRRLSDLTGLSVESLRALVRPAWDGPRDGPLDRWIEDVKVRVHRSDDLSPEPAWHLRLEPVERGNFLKVPWWWLWAEESETGVGVQRMGWRPNDPGILAALAIAHVGQNFTTTTSYGKTGLASIAGVSPRTMASALEDAEQKGWITVDGIKGGPGRSGGGFGGLYAARRSVVYVRPDRSED